MTKFLILFFLMVGNCFAYQCETDLVRFYLVKDEFRIYDNYTLSYFFTEKNMEKYQKNKRHELEVYKVVKRVLKKNKDKDVLVVYTNLYCTQKSVFFSVDGKKKVISKVYRGKIK